MEISGSCSSSHLAAVQVEARLVPALKFQAWSPGGLCSRAAHRHRNPGLLRAVTLSPGCSLESPVELSGLAGEIDV